MRNALRVVRFTASAFAAVICTACGVIVWSRRSAGSRGTMDRVKSAWSQTLPMGAGGLAAT